MSRSSLYPNKAVILLLAITIFSATGYLLLSLSSFNSIAQEVVQVDQQLPEDRVMVATSAKPEVLGKTTRLISKATFADRRAVVLDRFFASVDSPLVGEGATFVKYCDHYGAPYHCLTLPAISYAETNYCKGLDYIAKYNCWGFGGAGSNRYTFGSFDEAIDLITDRLTNQYGIAFMNNPGIAYETYCGSGCLSWGPAVRQSMLDINQFAIDNGFGSLL